LLPKLHLLLAGLWMMFFSFVIFGCVYLYFERFSHFNFKFIFVKLKETFIVFLNLEW
jgi:hypothetical protein